MLLVAALVCVVVARPRPAVPADDRGLARARVRSVRRRLRCPAAVVARRRRDAQGSPVRRAARPAARRRVLPRPRPRADRVGALTALPHRARDCSGRRRVRSGRRVSRAALVLARLGGLVLASARLSTTSGSPHLPENFVYNAGNGVVFRRLTSTFLSPLATAYLLVVALFFIPLRTRWGIPLAVLLFAAILWTHTRAALVALVVALLLLAALRRSPRLVALAAAVLVVSFAFVQGYDHFAPRTHFTASELHKQEQIAQQHPNVSNDPTRGERVVDDASTCRACATVCGRSPTIRGASASATPA